jgi:hypothetical protein
MSREYAMSRVKDALDKSNGNHLKAQRLLLQWLEKDHTLLLGLVTPHLQSIITHAISHAAMPQMPKKEQLGPPPKKVSVSAKDTGEFGAAMLQTMRGETASFGQPDGAVSRPGATSQKHVDTMHALAAASKDGGTKGKKK